MGSSRHAAMPAWVPRGLLVLAGIALIAASFTAPAALGASVAHGRYATHAKHQVTRTHIRSAVAAAKRAADHPRPKAASQPPHMSVKIAHPARTSMLRGASISPTPRSLAPDLSVAQQFDGLTQAESGDVLPPDPWVAASSFYVVQVVNSMVRISNRAGTSLQTLPTWLLFGLTPDQFESDGRVIWDAVHGRWVGTAISFNSDASSNFLYLIVSDGADPTAGWATYAFAFGTDFPDFPSIASSNDKIVLTDNTFDTVLPAYLGAEFITVTWASALVGAPVGNDCIAADLVNARAAQVLSSSFDVHLIQEDAVDGEAVYTRLAGSGTCNAAGFKDTTDLGTAFAFPPDPRQTPGDTIGSGNSAVDERPTDAIWQSNHLWWVSTAPLSYDADVTVNDAVVIGQATTVVTGAPTVGTPIVINAADGTDDFVGGIGVTRNGTLFVSYSQSSSSDPISLWVNQVPPTGVLGSPTQVDVSDASYANERWGDFAGIAMDPVGAGSVWAAHEVAAGDGTWRTDVLRLVADNDAPTVPGIPVSSLVAPTTLGGSMPVRVSWPASTDVSSNVAYYQVDQSIDLGPFVNIGNVAGTGMIRQLLRSHTYQFRIRAVDAVGNVGGWRATSTLTALLAQSTSSTSYTGTWGSQTNVVYSGGTTKYSGTAGASATFTATAARAIAIVVTRALTRGSFKVYVDGVLKGTVSSYGAPTNYRRVIYQVSWPSAGTHKVKIVISGTVGHPRVDLDAFVVLR